MRQKVEIVGNEIRGANKTLSFVIKAENQADVGKLAATFVAQGSVICTDESNAYDALHAKYDSDPTRIFFNHSVESQGAVSLTLSRIFHTCVPMHLRKNF